MFLAIVAIVGLTVTQYGCRNEDALVTAVKKDQQAVSQKNGWLTFPAKDVFEATMAKLHASEKGDELTVWEQQFDGFASWRTAQQEEVDDEKEKEKRIDIPDPLLTTVLNKDGRIQIADTIYQLAEGLKEPHLFAVPEKYAADLLKGTAPQRITGVVVHKIGLHLMPFFPTWEDNERAVTPNPISDICSFPTQVLFPWWGQKGGQIYNDNSGNELARDNGRNVRIDYHRWRVGFLFYSSVGVRVKIYKHTRLGGWMSTVKMNNVNLQACSKGMVIIPGLFPVPYSAQVSASGSNTNSLERNLKWAAAPFHVEVVPDHFNFTFSVNYKGQQIGRSIRE